MQYQTNLNLFLIYLALSLVKFIAKLKPYQQLYLGKKFGQLLQKLLPKHRKIVSKNLHLCFPNEQSTDLNHLATQYFENFGMGLLECCLAGFTASDHLPPYQINGLDSVKKLMAEKKPIIFVSAHFSTMLMMGRLMSEQFKFSAVFRLQRDSAFNALFSKYTQKYGVTLIRPKLTRIIEALKEHKTLLYFIDQDHGKAHSVFAPFFNIQTATIRALPALTQAVEETVVIPVFCYRHLHPNLHYELNFLPPLKHYPSHHDLEDATRLNQMVETAIQKQPESYFWYYKRFRTRPEGEESLYE